MPGAERTFRVFVSSTFDDMEYERNALHERVVPKLRELCKQRGARFQAVDLRWGVSDEAAYDQQTVKVCLSEIERCQKMTPRPNFVVVLGDRYGWCPLPAEIPAEEFEAVCRTLQTSNRENRRSLSLLKRWYKRDENAVPSVYCLLPRTGRCKEAGEWALTEQRLRHVLTASVARLELAPEQRAKYETSATEQEVRKGVFGAENPKEQVFCFFREIADLPDSEDAERFIDTKRGRRDKDAHARLTHLKGELRREVPENTYDYKATWWGGGTITTDHLAKLCDDVFDCLAQAINAQLDQLERVDPLDQEKSAHERFGMERARFFTGRARIQQAIERYLTQPARAPLAVVGASGSGKSALMAHMAMRARQIRPDAQVVSRFIGVTPASSDGRLLLQSICQEIARASGRDESEVPTTYKELVTDFQERLANLRPERPLILFIDALDQLSNAYNAQNLTWLPAELPEHVHLVVSTLCEETRSALQRKLPDASSYETLAPMSADEGEVLLDQWLTEAQRTLQPQQKRDILDKFAQQPLPLYLRLAFEQAKRWSSYRAHAPLHGDIPGIIRDLFSTLSSEANHDSALVSRSLGYIAAARNGLAEDELLDVLSHDARVYGRFVTAAHHAPPDLLTYSTRYLEERGPEEGARGKETMLRPKSWLRDVLSDPKRRRKFLAFARKEYGRVQLPIVLWSRLYLDLEPYLTERNVDGAPLLAFYHRQLTDVVQADYLSGRTEDERHRALARYFGSQRDTGEVPGTEALNLRKLSELPYQQRTGKMWGALEATLSDLSFVEDKCMAGLVYDLVLDYNGALEQGNLPIKRAERVGEFARFVRAQSHVLRNHPDLALQQATNEPHLTRPAKSASRLLKKRKMPPPLIKVNKPRAASPCLFTLEGHDGKVWSCDVSCDSKIVSACDDSTLKIWNATNGEELLPLEGHHVSVGECSFSMDGKRIVSSDRNGVIKVWDVATGTEIASFTTDKAPEADHSLSPNGRYLVFPDNSNRLAVWDLTDLKHPKPCQLLVGHACPVKACDWSPDGRRIVSGAIDGRIKLWDVRSGEPIMSSPTGHTKAVWRCKFLKDGASFVSASEDGTLKRWDAETLEELGSYAGHDKPVWTIDVSDDGKWIISGSFDATLKLWDLERNAEVATFVGHEGQVWGSAFFPEERRDGQQVVLHAVSASWDETLKIWDVATPIWGATQQREREREYPSETEKTSTLSISNVEASEPPCLSALLLCSAFSPDGTLIATSTWDGCIRVWVTDTGAEIQRLSLGVGYVTALAFSPDGEWILAGSDDGKLTLVNTSSWTHDRAIAAHTDQVCVCSFSSDGTLILSSSRDRSLKIWEWNADRDQPKMTFADESETFESCAMSPDMRWVLGGTDGGRVRVWDAATGEEKPPFTSHSVSVLWCQFSPDGTHVVSASMDGIIKLWEFASREEQMELAHSNGVQTAYFSRDGSRLVSASWDRTLRVWDTASWKVISTMEGHTDELQDGRFSPDASRVISASLDGTLRLWDADTGTEIAMVVPPTDWVKRCVFSPNGKQLLTCSHDRTLKLWDGTKGTELLTLSGHTSAVQACAFSPRGPLVASGSSDGTLRLWNARSGETLATLEEHRGPVAACAFSPDGKRVVSGSWDSTIKLWDVGTRASIRTLLGHADWVQQVTFSPDGAWILSRSVDKTVRLWNANTGELMATSAHRYLIEDCSFSPAGDGVVYAAGNELLLWDMNGQTVPITGHAGDITCCVFSPDGSKIASGSTDHSVKIWDAMTHKLLVSLEGHEDSITACAFSPSGAQLLSGSSDNLLKLWDVTSGKELSKYWADHPIRSIAWHPSGQLFAVGDDTGDLHLLKSLTGRDETDRESLRV